MVLEAIVVCLDNSEWSRNGDFAPSRWDSQQDAGNIICEAKTQQNPENTLGVMAYAGRRVDVKLTQTNDISLLLNAIGTININGEADFTNAVKVAQLSLKHRQNKSQRQRIIIFVGHPLREDEAHFEELGVRMKRNNVAVDIINFAHPENVPKLIAMVNAANSNGNSHFLDVPMGVAQITDVLIASPIINEGMEDGGNPVVAAGAGGAGIPAASQFADYGGIDPNLDPELAMALRISLEEERQRQVKPEEQPAGQTQPAEVAMANPVPAAQPEEAAADDEEMDEEQLLQQALLLSKSMAEGETPAQQDQQQLAVEYQDLLKDNEFIQDIAKDLGIDGIDEMMEEAKREDEEKKKKEDQDKK